MIANWGVQVVDERLMLSAINKGVPVIAAERDVNKPPTKQIMTLADGLFQILMEGTGTEDDDDHDRSKSGIRIFGR